MEPPTFKPSNLARTSAEFSSHMLESRITGVFPKASSMELQIIYIPLNVIYAILYSISFVVPNFNTYLKFFQKCGRGVFTGERNKFLFTGVADKGSPFGRAVTGGDGEGLISS
jgi:hypothetical protein